MNIRRAKPEDERAVLLGWTKPAIPLIGNFPVFRGKSEETNYRGIWKKGQTGATPGYCCYPDTKRALTLYTRALPKVCCHTAKRFLLDLQDKCLLDVLPSILLVNFTQPFSVQFTKVACMAYNTFLCKF